MKNGSKRTISRIVAFIMIVSSMFANLMVANAVEEPTTPDEVVSNSSIATDEGAVVSITGDIFWSADDLSVVSAVESNLTLDSAGTFTYSILTDKSGAYKSAVDGNKKTWSDGTQFVQRLKTGGTSVFEEDKGIIHFTAPDKGTLKIYAITSSNTAKRKVEVHDSTGTVVGDIYETGGWTGTPTSEQLIPMVVEIPAAGEYTIGSLDGAINYYGMSFTAAGGTDEPKPEDPSTGAPEAGSSYEANFVEYAATAPANDPLDGVSFANGFITVHGGAYSHDTQHGAAVKDGDTISVKVAGNAVITLGLCAYGNATEYIITNEAGEVIGKTAGKGSADGEEVSVDYVGAAATLTITVSSTAGEGYLHSVKVANSAAPVGEAKNFTLFLDDIAQDNVIAPGVYTGVLTDGTDLGESKIELIGEGETQFTPELDAGKDLTRGGREHVNAYKAGKRNVNSNELPSVPAQGDGTAVVFTPAEDGMLNTYFYSTSFLRVWDFNREDGAKNGYTDSEVAAESYAIPVKSGHVYVLSTTGKTNNCAFVGFTYAKDDPAIVSFNWDKVGSIDYSMTEITLIDADLGTEAGVIKVAEDQPTIKLMLGHSYKLVSNDGGVGPSVNDSDTFTVENVGPYTIKLVEIPDETLTGKFHGEGSDTITSVKFINMVNGRETAGVISSGGTYTASIKPGDYNTVVASSGAYYTRDRVKVVAGAENTNDIYIESLDNKSYAVGDEIQDANSLLKFEGFKFHSAEYGISGGVGSTITVPVKAGQSVTVTGSYDGRFTVVGNGANSVAVDSGESAMTATYNTADDDTLVTVTVTETGNVAAGSGSAYIHLIEVKLVSEVPFTDTLEVPSADYPTLKDAVSAIKSMKDRPEGEAGRVTIKLTADVQEQIVFDAPYITLDGQGHEISWYYGQTGFYYSVGAGGLYDEGLFQDKYEKTEASGSLWGGVAIIRGDYFRTINTTYRNTFNYEVTDKEIEDGAEGRGNVKGIITKDTDVTAYNAKERSNCFYIEAKGIEAYKCQFLSSQDTFGRNGSSDGGYSVYCKDCVIGGNTDYICGEFKAIYDNCELQWYTYPSGDANNVKIGYIVAPKTNPYVFRNCEVTTSGTETAAIAAADGTGEVVTGLWGRTWGAGSKAYFINCETNGHILDTGWGEMSTGDGATAEFYEYGNTNNGEPFTTTGGAVEPKTLTDEEAQPYISDEVLKEVYGTDENGNAAITPEYYDIVVPTNDAKSFTFFIEDIAKDVDGVKTAEPGDYTGVVTLNDGTSTVDLGDSVISLIGNGETKYTPEIAAGVDVSIAGREHISAYKAGQRHATANEIPSIMKPGEGTAIVFTPAADGVFNTYFYSTSYLRVWDFNTADGTHNDPPYLDSETLTTPPGNFAFQAKAGHTYVLSTTGKTNNCAYIGFEYIVDEPIEATFNISDDGLYDYSNVIISLTDEALGTKVADLKVSDGATQTISLSKGHTYKLSTNDGGAGIKYGDGDTIKIEGEGPYDLNLIVIPDVQLSGKFIGGDAKDVSKVEFVSMVSGARYEADLTDDGYTISIKPGEFNTIVTSDKYYTKDRASVLPDQDNTDDIYLESLIKSKYVLPEEISAPGTVITFDGVTANNDTSVVGKAGSKIIVPVHGKQKVTVAGWYSGTWDINGQNSVTTDNTANAASPTTNSYITDGTETEVTINLTGEGSNYIYWITLEDVTKWNPNYTSITVPGDFATLKEAVAYIRNMEDRPSGEAGRITIKLTDDVQEQIVFDAPYITLDGQGHEISWYYGQTGYYYSIDPGTGLYDETLFQDKYSKTEGNGSLWGGVAIIRGDYFRTVNTTYKNTFNYEVTDKEIEDGAENRGNIKGIITKDTDVTAYNAKERSNCFYIEAKGIEAYNCQFLSSQDTFGRNGSTDGGYSVYCRDCVIGGNTDYICGEFKALFDNCELQWFSYPSGDSNNPKIGYITAPKTNPYVFRNCQVTTSGKDGGDVVTGLWGRTWGAGSQAYFLNCETNGHILDTGWGEMSTGDGASAVFGEYGNTNNGQPFTTTGGAVEPKTLTDEEAQAYVSDDVLQTVYGGTFKPYYYEFASTVGDVDENGEINVIDASLTFQYVLKHDAGNSVFNKVNADVNADGTIDTEDVALILQKVLDSTFLFPGESPAPAEPENKPTVWVVGDSTGCHYSETTDLSNYFKRVGFGDKIGDYIYADVQNLALSGRSSKSYIADPEYKTLTDGMKEGDYLIIAFGHNDEKADDTARYTFPSTAENPTTKDTEGSFKNSLYVNYIKPAMDKGVTPIVCSPIVRRTTGAAFSDSQLHKTNGGDYAQDALDLATEVGITSVDLTTLTKDLYTQMGPGTECAYDFNNKVMSQPTGTAALHAAGANGAADNTHLNNYGAKYVAYLLAEAIKASDSPLKEFVKPDNVAPTDADLVINPEWAAPANEDLTGDQLNSRLWKTTDPWHGTVFGDCGGAEKIEQMNPETGAPFDPPQLTPSTADPNKSMFEITENADGTVYIRNGSPAENYTGSDTQGKISSTSDAFTMYYQPIDATGNFEISGTIVVDGYLNNNQVSFGAIISDNIKIDTYEAAAYKYIAAGPLKFSDIGKDITSPDGTPTGEKNKAVLSFGREDGATLKTGQKALAEQIPYGHELKVSVKKVGNQFTTTVQDLTAGTEPVVDTYTCDMEGTAYAGFFATRCAAITVKDIVANNEVVE